MRFSTTAAALSALTLVSAQTFTDCNPTQKSCPSDPALGTTATYDFKSASSDWTLAEGTQMTYGSDGAEFTIKGKGDAPTVSLNKYIMFGKVSVTMKAAPGTGIVSSFILESDDLDEIDWEWLGSTDTNVESNFFGKGNTTTYNRAQYHDVSDPIGTAHTYTVDWTADAIKWSIDGNVVRTLNYGDDLALNGKNYPQTPMKVKMGNWVGCADAAAAAPGSSTEGTCSWAGGPADFSKAPFVMSVSNVVVQDYSCGTSYSYGDNSGSWQSIKGVESCNGNSSPSSGASSSASATSTSGSSSATPASSTGSSASATGTSTSASQASSAPTSAGSSAPSSATPSSASQVSTMVTAQSGFASPSTTGSASSGSNFTTSSRPSSTSAPFSGAASQGRADLGVLALGVGLGYFLMQ